MSPDLESQASNGDRPVLKGYLKKLFTNKKDRFFVLKDRPHAKLEYFESEKKYNSKGSKPKRSIDLRKVWNIDKKTCAKHKHIISIYTQNEYFAMAANTKQTQEMWVNCLQNVTAACNTNIQMYRHIWKVVLDNKDIEQCNSNKVLSLHGPHRCCITDNAMVLIKLDNSGNIPDLKRCFEIKIPSIRTCGHRENRFFIEPGRSLAIGTGKLWMELDDPVIADSMHQTILSIMYSLKSDIRPRSDSANSIPGRSRVRREYNPPPSKVGMGKPVLTPSTPVCTHFNKPRTRCESFPATHVAALADEARYRTSSEGETTLRRFQNMKFRDRNSGGNSPGNRIRPRVSSFGKRFPHPTHYNTMSYHGSYTSSSSLSSMDHHCGSSTVSENMSSDEYSSSPCEHFHRFGRSVTPDSMASSSIHEDAGCAICTAPPPPSCPPLSLGLINTTLSHEYVNTQPFHLRSQSLDDNLSCGMETSSLSTSPNMNMVCSWQASGDSEYSQMTPRSCAAASGEYVLHQPDKPMETDEYADMSFPSNITKMDSSVNDEYASMIPGKPTTPINVSTLEKEGYVDMRPCSAAKSLPQDIEMRHRVALPGRMGSGSYSPKSDYSRSPDKSKLGSAFRRTKRLQSESGPSLLPVTVDISQEHQAMPNYCAESYAIMNPADQEMTHFDDNSYLEMSPMSVNNTGNSGKTSGGIFHALLSVTAETKPIAQYPHQIVASTSDHVESNSLDRKRYTSRSARRHKSMSMSKVDRKLSLKIVADPKPAVDESKSASPGGEYVNIDYQRALQHSTSYLTASPSLLKKFKHKTLPNNALKLS